MVKRNSSRGSLQLLKNIMWTSIKCLTEHEKNEVYQIVNIDVPTMTITLCRYSSEVKATSILKIRKKSRNFIHSNSNFLSKSRNLTLAKCGALLFAKFSESKAPAKRSQHANATCRNIVGRNMLRAFGHRVAMCCDMLGVVGSSLKMVKSEPTTPNKSQHVATGWPNARNMLRPTMLRHVALVCCDRLAGA